MMPLRLATILALLTCALASGTGRQGTDDPALRAAVEKYFGTQEAEDVDGYLALWSASAQRPRPEQLKFIFLSGDDKFFEITIVRVAPAGSRVRVRVTAIRARVSPSRMAGGPPIHSQSKMSMSLTYVREGEDWKLLREGPAVDGLAESLIESATADEREQLLAADSDLVNEGLVMALSRRASQATTTQAYAAAQLGYERMLEVARRIGNQKLEGEALQNLANSMYFQRNFVGALQIYEQRLAVERARDNQEGIAGALLGIATIRYSFAEYGAALTSYREALAIQEKLGDEGTIAITLISTGNVLYLQGDYPGAIADYARSRDLNKKILNTLGEADALEGLGRVFVAQGDYGAALDAFGGVLAEAKARKNDNEQGTALLNIGDVHFRLGNFESARISFDHSRTRFEASKDLGNAGRAWQALALTDLVATRFAPAETEYGKSIASCSAVREAECVAQATAGLAFAQTAQDKFKEGIANYKKAIQAFTALSRTEPAARTEIGLSHALTRSGAHVEALETALRAKRAAETLKNDDVLWRAYVAEAEALRKLADGTRALSAAQSAAQVVDRLMDAAKVRPSAPVARDTSLAFALLAVLQAESGDAAAAFESAERLHANDLRILLASSERDISRGMTQAERDEEKSAAVELVGLHAQLSREKDLPKPDAARIARLEKAVAEATEKRIAQQDRLFQRLPELRIWRGLVPAVTRADVAGLLADARTVLVEFVVADDDLLVIAVRRGEHGLTFTSHLIPVTRRELAERVAKLTQPDILRDRHVWKHASDELMKGWPPVLRDVDRAIVIPHEILWRVPFEALPAAAGYLADSTSVVYAQSAAVLVRTPARTPKVPANDVLVLAAAPELAPAALERITQTAPGWTIRHASSGEQEAKRVTSDANPERTVVLTSAGATETALLEQLPAATVVHIGAPFRVNGASPLFSPVLLAQDGALEARAVMNLDLQARIAIFSDGAAMTMRDAADEASVVHWAWLAAGVPMVIMPRWPGDELMSGEMLAELHRRLRAGDAPDVALQAARASIRSRADTSAPFHWAGWILIGRQ